MKFSTASLALPIGNVLGIALIMGMTPALAADKSLEQSIAEARLEGQIGTAILLNRHLSAFEIDIDVEGDTAILTGTVDESVDKDLAERVAKNAKGITKVDNRIAVDAAAKMRERGTDNDRDFDEAVEDASTTASVKSRLLWNTKNRIFAIPAAAPARPPKPRTAAMSATTKKMRA